MSDEHRKLYAKKGTGTVPKIKYRNNNQEDSCPNVLSNNLGTDVERSDYVRQYRNLQPMDTYVRQNGVNPSNGTSTPNTSRTNSRRNSVGTVPKCENVAKYPDKRQIESKLSQIREYLRVTSTLMTNMKNTDEQLQRSILSQSNGAVDESLARMVRDLVDSESKLVAILEQIDRERGDDDDGDGHSKYLENGIDVLPAESLSKLEPEQHDLPPPLADQDNLLLHLQLTAESQLREARLAQDKVLKAHKRNRNAETTSTADEKNHNDCFQAEMIRELEDRLRGLDTKNHSNADPYQNQIDTLQNRIWQLRDGNDNRNQLIQMLDNRDAQLQAEHSALQGKLTELQNKKMQVDQLVLQLQNMNDESEDDEMGNQVKKIVNMKEQLANLKDMLNRVQQAEQTISLQNLVAEPTADVDDQQHYQTTRRGGGKTDNIVVQNEMRALNRQPPTADNNIRRHRLGGSVCSSSNEHIVKDKQVNKKSVNERERARLQAELQAKKRELEELMCKHKGETSNLNHDVNNESKSDMGACGHPLYDGASNSWYPMPSNIYNLPRSNDSDECPEEDMNEYSEVTSSSEINPTAVPPMPPLSYPTSNYTKPRLHRADDVPSRSVDAPTEPFPSSLVVRSSESLAASPIFRSSSDGSPGKKQMQKQLELIKSMCDSMLDQTGDGGGRPMNGVHVRNNLTPSPIYTEPRRFAASSSSNGDTALNVVAPNVADSVAAAFPPMPAFPMGAAESSVGGYQSWLATNTLQTQAFMLNTLNQCCQMLWLQQRELASLRGTVNAMQERYTNSSFESAAPTMPPYMTSNPCLFPAAPNPPVPNNQYRITNQPKSNPAAPLVAGAASMPNLNHAHCSPTNIEQACASHCNLQGGRMVDAAAAVGLNNAHVSGGPALHVPSQLSWNGQALNNQVPPGNRANNYWDNFRSYSRQNLLSTTKSNEGFQATPVVHQAPKLNTEQQEEGVPRRTSRASRQRSNSSTAAVPPDVLNVNQTTTHKTNENAFAVEFNVGGGGGAIAFESYADAQPHDVGFKERSGRRNRNEWHDDTQSENSSPKCKLFEELRENVYKEVASLISANQGRPHFLIQLFRDLQLVSSDPLRRRTLQSIQSVITNSLSSSSPASATTTGATRQVSNVQRSDSDELPGEAASLSGGEYFVLQPIWPQMPKMSRNESDVDSSGPDHMSETLTLLNNHNEDVFSDALLHSLRDALVESTFSSLFPNANKKDGIIQKHFASMLTEALEQFRGKKVQEVRISVLQTIEDLLRGEISLIRLMRENMADGDLCPLDMAAASTPQFELPIDPSTPQIQNGDLAEADQSRVDVDDDDEGAVGGVLNILLERSSSSNAGQVINDENEMPKLDLVLSTESDVEFAEGLDQVPTRLTTHSTSRSNTPSKDKKTSRLDGADHF